MRAPLLVGLLAVALTATACSAAPDPNPLPSSTADGMITEITNPEAPFDTAWTTAVGNDGSAAVFFYVPSDMSLPLSTQTRPPDGLALVYRDGTYDIIIDPSDDRFVDEWAGMAAVSDTTVAWVSHPRECDPAECPAVIHFWDRASGQVSDVDATLTEGEYAGRDVQPMFFTLVGDVLFWVEYAIPHHLLAAASSDGRVWYLVNSDQDWVDVGYDACASTPDHPVLWVNEISSGETSSYVRFWQFDVTDPHHPLLVEGSEWSTEPTSEDYIYIGANRCGDEVLANSHPGRSSNDPAIVTAGDPSKVDVLEIGASGHIAQTLILTPDWIVIGPSILSTDEPNRIVHRSSGSATGLPYDEDCFDIEIRGDYVSWRIQSGDDLLPPGLPPVASCTTYIGVLTPPTE